MPATPQVPALPGTSPLGFGQGKPNSTSLVCLRPLATFRMLGSWGKVLRSVPGDKVEIAFMDRGASSARIGVLSFLTEVDTSEKPDTATLALLDKAISDRNAHLSAVAEKRRAALSAFRLGQRVSFDGGKRGTLFGIIISINTKTATVGVEGSSDIFRVTPGLLRDATVGAPPVAKPASDSTRVRLAVAAMSEAEAALYRTALAERAAL
jgi:hypothetical protein